MPRSGVSLVVDSALALCRGPHVSSTLQNAEAAMLDGVPKAPVLSLVGRLETPPQGSANLELYKVSSPPLFSATGIPTTPRHCCLLVLRGSFGDAVPQQPAAH
mmetsp:Transcript_57758/g.122869  ORF Transcript_57758/g.122869 Transcript_57758/m.122869 type:complete len:103 (+) Transcript_57758:455-763(+)